MKVANKIRNFITRFAFAVIAASIALASCGPGGGAPSAAPGAAAYGARQVAEIIIAELADAPVLYPLLPQDEHYAAYLSDIYLLDPDALEDGAIYYAGGIEACEIAVIKNRETAGAKDTEAALVEYQARRAVTFTGYAPLQAALVEKGAVVKHGAYTALLLCRNPRDAERVFMQCFSDNPPQPPAESILAARIASATTSTSVEPATTVVFETSSTTAKSADPITTAAIAAAATTTAITAKPTTANTTAAETSNAQSTAAVSSAATTTAAIKEATAMTVVAAAATAASVTATATTEVAISGSVTIATTTDAATTAAITTITATVAEPSTTAVSSSTVATVAESSSKADSSSTAATTTAASSAAAATTAVATDVADAYDHSAVLAAWNGGDAAALSEKNKKILDACGAVIAKLISDDMSDYEKELVIHDWMVTWAGYDMEAASNAPDAAPDPDNDNPYGLLYKKKAICRGYTAAFQLFMDMLGIECITVEGITTWNNEEHAWNMIRLDGEWYCVDVTWNDPVGGAADRPVSRKYFNVTSQFLRDHDHQWDESGVPEATATAYAWID